MKISASSFETAKDLCMRKWWLKEERDMPEGKVIKGAAFGTIIHGVCERYLLADDLGNGPSLYPEGWNAGLDEADSVLVKLLVQAAIDQGHLVRRKGRKPEQWMNTPIIIDDDVVQLTGKLDVVDLEGFEDHKSTSAVKWTKDEEGLASDSAMLFYAVEWCRQNGEAVQVKMRYNYFLKDPSQPETWSVEVRVSRDVVEHFKQQELMPTARAMVAVVKQQLTDEQWEQVEGPKTQDACRAFGGCPYATICGRVEQPAQYRARVARILSNRTKEKPVGIFTNKSAPATPITAAASAPAVATASAPAAPPAAGAAPVTVAAKPAGIFAKRNSTPAAAPVLASPASPVPAPQVQLAKPELPVKTAEPVPGAAPWAHPGCRACKGTGMHPTEKRPCKGCRSTRMVQKLPTDEAFEISYDAAGNLCWQEKGTEACPVTAASGSIPAIPPVTAPSAQPVVPTVTEPVEKVKKPPRGKKQPEVAADVQVTKPVVVQDNVAADCTIEQHKESAEMVAKLPLMLACGVSMEKAPAYYKVASMADVFAEAAKMVAEASGKEFFGINAFERRDALARMAPQLAERLAGCLIICPRSTPDVDALVQALKPFAGFVFCGLS